MNEAMWLNGLEEIEENLGSVNNPQYTEGVRKHLKRRIFDRERITDIEWAALIEHLVDHKTFLPKVKDFMESLHAVRKSRGGAQGTQERDRIYIKCERCNPDGDQSLTSCGFLYARHNRQPIPCGCGNTPQSMADVLTFQQLVTAGKVRVDDVERPDGSYLYEGKDAARERIQGQVEAAQERLRERDVIVQDTVKGLTKGIGGTR